MPLDQPGRLERLEQNEEILLASCVDLREQLSILSDLHARRDRLTRAQVNQLIASERERRKKCNPPEPSSA